MRLLKKTFIRDWKILKHQVREHKRQVKEREMDYHDLQKKLFELDPSDPQQDLAKLRAAAEGSQQITESKQILSETTTNVAEGSLPVDVNSLSDFVALAGVTLNEQEPTRAQKQVQQKMGQGARQIGQKIGAKGSAGMMTKALDQVSQGGALTAQLSKQIAPFAKQLGTILSDQQLRTRFMQLVKQAEAVSKKSQQQAAPAAESTSIKDELYRRLAEYKRK